MKKTQVVIGERYVAKVSSGLTIVKILSESPYGGWDTRNEETGRKVHIKSAMRLRRPAYDVCNCCGAHLSGHEKYTGQSRCL